jgi:hypothetical protein
VRRTSPALACAILGVGILFLAAGAVAQDVQREVVRLVTRAREFQTPERALSVWGAPRQRFGETRPLFVYDPQRPAVESVELKYKAPADGPKRLEFIDITIWKQGLGEAEIRGWLGPPEKVEKDPVKLGQAGARWLYGQRDQAGLRIIHVLFVTAATERARTLSRAAAGDIVPTIVIRVDGTPK